MENSGLTIPLGIRASRVSLPWILSNFKTDGFGESQFLTFGLSRLQAAALREAKPGPGQALRIRASSAHWNGVTKSQDQPCSIPALGEAEGSGGVKVKGAAPCFWMLGMNLHARSRRWEMPHPWTTGHICTDLSCHHPCLVRSPRLTGSTLYPEDHSYIARLGRQ